MLRSEAINAAATSAGTGPGPADSSPAAPKATTCQTSEVWKEISAFVPV
jgi:hypothetical protein